MKYKFISKSVFFPLEKILVIADLHIGHEEAMNKAGIFLPRIQFSEIIKDLNNIFLSLGKRNRTQRINEIIICGDLKHEFSQISEQEWKETLDILDYLEKKCKKIILVRGNHDKILGPIAEKKKIEIVDFYIKNDVCFIHGDKIFPEILGKKIKTIVMGHRHPAVVLQDKYKKEKFKCFLVGKWKRKEVIILPSFFPLIEGTDLIEEGCNLLFIKERDLRNFEVYAVGDRIYDFGKLKSIGRLE